MASRAEVALQLTLKNFNANGYLNELRATNANEANVKLAEAVAEFFNTVYDKLTDGN